jgi:hypothetical protein
MARARTVNPPRAIVPPGGPSRGRKAYRYSIVEHDMLSGTRYSIQRALPDAAITQCWKGREMGWMPDAATCIPKLYARYGDAYRTLRKLQAIDTEVMTAAGRRRRLERMAPDMLEALRRVYDFLDANYDDRDMPDILPLAREVVTDANRILNGN